MPSPLAIDATASKLRNHIGETCISRIARTPQSALSACKHEPSQTKLALCCPLGYSRLVGRTVAPRTIELSDLRPRFQIRRFGGRKVGWHVSCRHVHGLAPSRKPS